MSVVQQGLTIHAYQDGNRLILSFENVDEGLKSAILSMVGGVMIQSIEGLTAPKELDYQPTYDGLSDKVEEAIEDEAAAMFANINVDEFVPEVAGKEHASEKEEAMAEENTTSKEMEDKSEDVVSKTPSNENGEQVEPDINGTETKEEVKSESSVQNPVNEDEGNKELPSDTQEKDTSKSKGSQPRRYAFNKGCFEKMTPEEVLEQNKLGAIKFFYDHRNEYPYSHKVMKREIATACKKYIAKITKDLSHVDRAIIWLYENVSDIVVAEFQNMTQEEITKDVIVRICSCESKEFCESVARTLFNKIVEAIEK